MPKGENIISSIEMRSLILEALVIENKEDTPRKQTFKMYGYRGCIADLRAIVEHLAIKHGLIDQVVSISNSAWGVPGTTPRYQSNTNFNDDELDIFSEQVHFLVFQNLISPGAYGNYGNDLPYFHVTKYGLGCLAAQDILPYDPEKFLQKLRAYSSIDAWELFYIEQSLLCYNSGALESSIIMLGLAGEYIANRLIEGMVLFLAKNEITLHRNFNSALSGKNKVSQRYIEYEKILGEAAKQKDSTGSYKYSTLQSLKPSLDGAAKTIYATYLRLTRNELAHPIGIRMDKLECLTLLMSFIKYSETQHKYLDFYIANS